MSQEIKAGVRLNLNDQFSSKIQRAGVSIQGFQQTAVGVAGKVNQAFSGLAGTLGTVGVALGTAALARGGIEFQDTVRRIATNTGAYGREANEFGRALLRAAYDAKVSEREMLAFASAAASSAVSLDDIAKNMPFMADLIQGVGVSGDEAGRLLAAFLNRGADADTLQRKLNKIVEITAQLGNASLPELLRYLSSLLETKDGGLEGIVDMVIAVNMLCMGTDRVSQAAYQYRAAMNDFARPEVREAIQREIYFKITDDHTFAEIMQVLAEFGRGDQERIGNFGRGLNLSNATLRAFRQYDHHFTQTIENLGKLGDTSNAIAWRAEQNASTIQGSLNRLRIAASEFASTSLIKPIEKLTNLLDSHPNGMRNSVMGLTAAIAALGAMKAFSTVLGFLREFKAFRGGGGAGIGGGFSGAGIPVKVTNMGGGGLGGPGGNIAGGRAGGAGISPATLAAGGALAALAYAPAAIMNARAELAEIKEDQTLSERERSEAQGGAIGEAAGTIMGAGAGAVAGGKLGATIGTFIAPVIGTAIGGALGAGIGAAIGARQTARAGRAAGTRIGGAVSGDLMDEVRSVGHVPQPLPPVSVDGEIILRNELVIDDRNYHLRQTVDRNSTPYRFATGSTYEARLIQ